MLRTGSAYALPRVQGRRQGGQGHSHLWARLRCRSPRGAQGGARSAAPSGPAAPQCAGARLHWHGGMEEMGECADRACCACRPNHSPVSNSAYHACMRMQPPTISQQQMQQQQQQQQQQSLSALLGLNWHTGYVDLTPEQQQQVRKSESPSTHAQESLSSMVPRPPALFSFPGVLIQVAAHLRFICHHVPLVVSLAGLASATRC
jgi:hypothetical protein